MGLMEMLRCWHSTLGNLFHSSMEKIWGIIEMTKVPSALVLYLTDDFTVERLIVRGMKVATIIFL